MYKVMIAEDEMLVRAGLKSFISWEKYGMTVVSEVSNGQLAWESYVQYRPDIILTDIKMPVLDGLQLIQRIREKDWKTKIIILSCVEDFSLARKAIKLNVFDYILKLTMTPEEMNAVLLKIKNELDAEALRPSDTLADGGTQGIDAFEKSLIGFLAYDVPAEKLAEVIRRFRLPLSAERASMAVMKISRYQKLEELYRDSQGYLIRYALLNILNEILSRKNLGIAVRDSQACYILLLNADVKQENDLKQVAETIAEIRQDIKNFFNVSVTFAIGEAAGSLTQLKTLYEQCRLCLYCNFFLGKDTIVYSPKLSGWSAADYVVKRTEALFEEEKDLVEYRDAVMTGLRRLILEGDVDENGIRTTFFNVLTSIVNQTKTDAQEISLCLTRFLDECRLCENYDGILTRFSESLCALKKDLHRKSLYSREVVQSIDYIRENYRKQITLSDISDTVGFSPSYLSNLFRKELRLTFTEYLNRYRIERAAELLLTTTMKTYEIAYAVGFTDQSYFSRTFKKFTGMRPSEYKRMDLPDDPSGRKTCCSRPLNKKS